MRDGLEAIKKQATNNVDDAETIFNMLEANRFDPDLRPERYLSLFIFLIVKYPVFFRDRLSKPTRDGSYSISELAYAFRDNKPEMFSAAVLMLFNEHVGTQPSDTIAASVSALGATAQATVNNFFSKKPKVEYTDIFSDSDWKFDRNKKPALTSQVITHLLLPDLRIPIDSLLIQDFDDLCLAILDAWTTLDGNILRTTPYSSSARMSSFQLFAAYRMADLYIASLDKLKAKYLAMTSESSNMQGSIQKDINSIPEIKIISQIFFLQDEALRKYKEVFVKFLEEIRSNAFFSPESIDRLIKNVTPPQPPVDSPNMMEMAYIAAASAAASAAAATNFAYGVLDTVTHRDCSSELENSKKEAKAIIVTNIKKSFPYLSYQLSIEENSFLDKFTDFLYDGTNQQRNSIMQLLEGFHTLFTASTDESKQLSINLLNFINTCLQSPQSSITTFNNDLIIKFTKDSIAEYIAAETEKLSNFTLKELAKNLFTPIFEAFVNKVEWTNKDELTAKIEQVKALFSAQSIQSETITVEQLRWNIRSVMDGNLPNDISALEHNDALEPFESLIKKLNDEKKRCSPMDSPAPDNSISFIKAKQLDVVKTHCLLEIGIHVVETTQKKGLLNSSNLLPLKQSLKATVFDYAKKDKDIYQHKNYVSKILESIAGWFSRLFVNKKEKFSEVIHEPKAHVVVKEVSFFSSKTVKNLAAQAQRLAEQAKKLDCYPQRAY